MDHVLHGPVLQVVKDVRYYIVSPHGRQRIQAECDLFALAAFKEHWTAGGEWSCKNPQRRLVKETRETIATD